MLLFFCFLALTSHRTTDAALSCPSQAPEQMKSACANAGQCFEGPGCDIDSGQFKIDQCLQAAQCGICYPDSPCKSVNISAVDQPAPQSDMTACMNNVTAKARAMALQLVNFNGGQGSTLDNMSQCGFQQLLYLNHTDPIHLVILFSAEDDLSFVKLLRNAARSVGGGVMLRNRIFKPGAEVKFATIAWLPSPAALATMLGSTEFADVLSTMKAELSAVSMSVTRLNIDVRVPATDCAYMPWDFDSSAPLPWPEKPGQEGYNKAFLEGDTGKAAQNLIFNKALSRQAAAEADFDYALGVAAATFKHGFSPHMALTCLPQASGSAQQSTVFCRSIQLAGDLAMGYNTIRIIEYASRRAMLSMMNDPAFVYENKADEWEVNVGLVSELIVDETITDIPQLLTPSFKALTGFDHAPTACRTSIRKGQTRSDILNHTCFQKSLSTVDTFRGPCISAFEANASCPAACQAIVDELEPCLGGMWNTYDAGTALLLTGMNAGRISAQQGAMQLSPRAWYLEVVRRGCRGARSADVPNAPDASTGSRLAQTIFVALATNIVTLILQ